jgi:iron complex transport system ATP-binding protein
VIVAEGLHRRIGGLAGIDMTAAAGAVTALIGPNGAGKSTLLDLLAGRSQPDRGCVLFGGRAIADWSPLDLARRRAFLPQQPELAFPLPVADLVRLGRAPYRHHPAARHDREGVEAALRLTDTWHLRARIWQRLSGGERQRVQLARVLAQLWRPAAQDGEPRMLLLDEPTASLDPGHRLAVMRLLRELTLRGIGVVIALHDLNDAARFADRVVLLEKGRVVLNGGPEVLADVATLSAVYGAEARLLAADGAAPVIVFR